MPKKTISAVIGMSETDRLRRERWLAAMKGEKQQVAVESVPARRIQGREIEIDMSKFTAARLGILREVLGDEKKRWPYYFHGEVGRGKTYLAAAIYLGWPKSEPAIWMPYTLFCERCEEVRTKRELIFGDGLRNFEFSVDTWWEHFSNAKLVVIDDLGVGEHNASRNEWVFELLERRYNKPLVFTSNLSPENMADQTLYGVFDARVISRIKAGKPIHLLGRDMRGDDYVDVRVE